MDFINFWLERRAKRGATEHTQGSETSQYLEEKRTTPTFQSVLRFIVGVVISLVAASETEKAQTDRSSLRSERSSQKSKVYKVEREKFAEQIFLTLDFRLYRLLT